MDQDEAGGWRGAGTRRRPSRAKALSSRGNWSDQPSWVSASSPCRRTAVSCGSAHLTADFANLVPACKTATWRVSPGGAHEKIPWPACHSSIEHRRLVPTALLSGSHSSRSRGPRSRIRRVVSVKRRGFRRALREVMQGRVQRGEDPHVGWPLASSVQDVLRSLLVILRPR